MLAARGKNNEAIAGLLVRLDIVLADGKKQTVVTDTTWQATPQQLPRGWQMFDYKPGEKDGWKTPISHGKYGMQPWGDFAQASQGPEALAADQIKLLPGFKAELLYTVPRDQGSWVSMTFDPKGRIIASDERGPLYRVTLPKDGEAARSRRSTRRRPVNARDRHRRRPGTALRVRQPVRHGQPRQRRAACTACATPTATTSSTRSSCSRSSTAPASTARTRSASGPTASSTSSPATSRRSPTGSTRRLAAHRNWAEDLLLPRNPDGGGHDPHVMAPGGWVARTDQDGKNWELLLRRPAQHLRHRLQRRRRAVHATTPTWSGTPARRGTARPASTTLVSGGEYGWRNGTGKWPAYYPDSLGAVVNIGLGSPTGVVFGTGAKFPAKYQRAFFMQRLDVRQDLRRPPDARTARATPARSSSSSPASRCR